MRSEQEMIDLILTTAREDDRIRAVILNGSRVNPNIKPDRFQDFDIVYVVTDITPFISDPTWIDHFGERMIIQTPDLMGSEAPCSDGGFTYLMEFMDGNRIDLSLIPVDSAKEMDDDSLSILLMDKDDRFKPFPPPSETSYLPAPPTSKAFGDCCNEFWWVSTYVAKSLARADILYAHHMLDVVMHGEMIKMLTWNFGIRTEFRQNPGKAGDNLKNVLPAQHWSRLLATFAPAEINATWEALMTSTELFRDCAREVAASFNFDYPEEDDARVSNYLRQVKTNANKTS
jgi:aminoglycoside 6-adenylyltransferase